jgi:lysophospholipase L1-like esterase
MFLHLWNVAELIMKKLIIVLSLLLVQSCELCQAQTQQRSTFYPTPTGTLDLGMWNAEWDSSFIRIGKFHQTKQDTILRTTVNGLPLVINAPLKVDSNAIFDKRVISDNMLSGQIATTNSVHQVYCMGNSLTNAGVYESYLGGLLGANWNVVNKGISGQRTDQMLARFTNDIVNNLPDYTVILGGINDIAQGYYAVSIENNLKGMYDLAKSSGIKVIGVHILPFKGSGAWTSDRESTKDSVNTWISSYLTSDYVVSVDAKMDSSSALYYIYNGGDYIHLTTAGYDTLGKLIYGLGIGHTGEWIYIKTRSATSGNINIPLGSYYQYNGMNILNANTYLDNWWIANSGNTATTGLFNIGLGNLALLYNATGGYNTAIGIQSDIKNISGNYRVAIGYRAATGVGYGTVGTGGYCTYVGAMSHNLDYAADVSNSSALGYNATTTKSNQVVLGNTSVTEVFTNGSLAIQYPTLPYDILSFRDITAPTWGWNISVDGALDYNINVYAGGGAINRFKLEFGTGNATFAGTINSGKVTSTDTVVGVFYRWTNAAYGGAYIADDHPDTMTFAGANEVHTIGGVHASAPLGYKLTSGGVLKNITVQDSSMTVGMTGKYDVAWSISFGSVTGVAPNAKFNAYIYVNDTKSEKTGAMRVLSGTNDIGTFCGTAMTLSLNANDIVKLKLINVDDANGNQVVVLYAKFHLSRIE